jgi:glucose/mannose-6-phosphate isomerase
MHAESMKDLIKNFPVQLKEALDIASRAELTESPNEIRNVIINGMGGSGIGGNITIEAIASEIRIPVMVNKDYTLPHYVNKNTLVIISSYSGETEETVKAFEEARDKDAKIVCITSGGKIADIATKKNIDLILLPTGFPPRAAIGYSVTQLLHILNYYYIISSAYKKEMTAAIELLEQEQHSIMEDARETALALAGKIPVLYSNSKMESVALRFRQQLNENSKVLGWYNVFPELNHNEFEAWKHKNDSLALVIFRNENDYARTIKRIDISKEIFKKYTSTIKEVFSKGSSMLERMLYHIHWGDWVSFYLAENSHTDIMDISSINYLKNSLNR